MKLYESYVAEAQARRRRRLAVGIVGAVMLATVAVSALLVLAPAPGGVDALSIGCEMPGSARAHEADCLRQGARRAG